MPTEDEDLAPLITCCPKCDTQFRVTEAQLQVAKGQVRCGSCLHVFDGTEHLLVDGEVLSGSGEADVDALLKELDEIERFDDLAEDVAEDAPGSGESFAENDDSKDVGERVAFNDLVVPSPAAEGLPEELPAIDINHEQTLHETNARLKALEDELMTDLKAGLSTNPMLPSTISGYRLGVPEEDEPELPQLAKAPDSPLTPGPDRTEGELTATPSGGDCAPQLNEQIEPAAGKSNDWRYQKIPAELLADERPQRGVGTWVVLAVALIALPAQVLWFQFDTWVKDETMRPVYAFICDVSGCELPLRRDVGLIVAKNSVLRDHPDQDEALIYDALLVNYAKYAQPYPFIELTLMTMGGQLIASRRFNPREYLGGEAADAKMMQPRTPIHISLEFKGPGQAPLNFQIRFLPAS